MSKRGTIIVVTFLAGCDPYTLSDAAGARAHVELSCKEPVFVQPRADLSPATIEVRGCGRSIRYTCTWTRRPHSQDDAVCVPETPPHVE